MENTECNNINKKTNTSKLPSHFECNDINIVSKQSIADEFNNFFVGVGSNLNCPLMETERRCTRPREVQRNNSAESYNETTSDDSGQEVA